MAAGDPPAVNPTEAAQIAQQTGQSEAAVTATIQAHEKANRALAFSQREVNEVSQDYSSVLNSLQTKLASFGVTMHGTGNLINQQATAFGLLTAGLITTTQKFNDLGAGIDPKRLGSFSDQTQTLVDTLSKGGSVIGSTTDAGKKMIGVLANMGVGGRALAETVNMSSTALAAFAKNVVTGADNTLRFQSAILQGVAAGGGMQQLYDGIDKSFTGIGTHLEKLNQVTQQFLAIQADAADATGLSSDELSKYTAVLLQTPAGLEAMSKGIDIAGTHMGTLTAVTQLAQGAGLNIAQTYQDINKTILQTGMSYEGATGFATRFADVSKDLHARTDDVRSALLNTSSAFKLWNTGGEQAIKMNQGLADSIKGWAGALEKAGVPAQTALELAESQTKQLGNLSEAQEAFISQQTGGAGGIKGALEYEQLLAKDPQAAQKKAAQTLQQQIGGKLVTRDEAIATGQEDKYMLERKLLTSGAVGLKAGSNQEAEDILGALSKGIEYKKTTEKDVATTAAQAIGKGKEQEQLTYTGIKQANLTAERVMLTAGTINAGTLEKAFSARAGENVNAGGGVNTTAQNLLQQRMNAGAAGTSGSDPMAATLHGIKQAYNDLPKLAGSGFQSVREQVVGPGPQPDLGGNNQSSATLPLSPAVQAAQAKLGPDGLPMNGTSGTDTRPFFPMLGSGKTGATLPQLPNTFTPADKQIGAAVSTKSPDTTATTTTTGARGGIGGGGGAGAAMNGPIPVTITGGALTMNLTGACPHCKAPITTSLQSQATNVAANTGHT